MKTYGDMKFQNLQGGFENFGKRFLFHMVWAMQNYKFDYFVRLDDDYFMCMDRFIREVPMPPKSVYHWGWVHYIKNLVRPEESVILLSKDLVKIFLSQDPDNMLCHKLADQMIGIWNEELHLPKFYHHDPRLHHDPPGQSLKKFKTEQTICANYIGIHGSYPKLMRTLWKHRGNVTYEAGKTFDDFAFHCPEDSVMNWRTFVNGWHAEPKLCKTNPDWGVPLGTSYQGREADV